MDLPRVGVINEVSHKQVHHPIPYGELYSCMIRAYNLEIDWHFRCRNKAPTVKLILSHMGGGFTGRSSAILKEPGGFCFAYRILSRQRKAQGETQINKL